MSIFVISDTWFNRLLTDSKEESVLEYNNSIISNWNNIVEKDDIVYVLGGFGIADLYHIIIQLNGEIHILNNYYNSNEKLFIDYLKEEIDKSADENLKSRIIFENNQFVLLKDYECFLSYFPLSNWPGKDDGVFCFHGFDNTMILNEHNISCSAFMWDNSPISIESIKSDIDTFKTLS